MSYLVSIFAAVFGLQLYLNPVSRELEFATGESGKVLLYRDEVEDLVVVDANDVDGVVDWIENGFVGITTEKWYQGRDVNPEAFETMVKNVRHYDHLVVAISWDLEYVQQARERCNDLIAKSADADKLSAVLLISMGFSDFPNSENMHLCVIRREETEDLYQ